MLSARPGKSKDYPACTNHILWWMIVPMWVSHQAISSELQRAVTLYWLFLVLGYGLDPGLARQITTGEYLDKYQHTLVSTSYDFAACDGLFTLNVPWFALLVHLWQMAW